VVQVTECLFSKHEVLSLNPSTTKQIKEIPINHLLAYGPNKQKPKGMLGARGNSMTEHLSIEHVPGLIPSMPKKKKKKKPFWIWLVICLSIGLAYISNSSKLHTLSRHWASMTYQRPLSSSSLLQDI
jgi:hypothetical protein